MNKQAKCILIGVIAGLLSGLFGVGGGIILVPAMTSYLAASQHIAHATSLAVIIPTALTGSLVYGRHGNLDISLALYLAAGSSIGALAGARLMQKLSAVQLQYSFGCLLIVIGLRMIWP